jgi:hypothetical protein
MAIGLTLQSALTMERRRGKCVCLLAEYLLNILYSFQFLMYRKSRAKKGKAGWPPASSKGDATPSPSKRQKVVMSEGTSEINTSPGPVTRRQR